MVEKVVQGFGAVLNAFLSGMTSVFSSFSSWFTDSSGDLNLLGISFVVSLSIAVIGFVFGFVLKLIRR